MTDDTETCEMCGAEREEPDGECPECGYDPAESGGNREEVVSIIALLMEADRRLNSLGSEGVMSIGPALTGIDEVQTKVRELARGYGAIGPGETLGALKHAAATERDVTVRDQPEWSVDGAVVTIGDTKMVLMEEGGEPASLDHVGGEDGYAAYRINGGNATLRFMEATE